MADKDKERMTSEFMELTNSDPERAKFYLESSGWDVQVAISSFFENDGNEMAEDEPEIVQEVPAPPPSGTAQPKKEPEDKKPEKKEKKSSSSSSSRIKTLRTLEASEGSSDEEGQAFYAGGSETSGQQILGPSKKKGDFVTDIFKSIREHGGEEVDPRKASTSHGSRSFGGTGYRLGQTPKESEVIPSTPNESRTSLQITIKMWKTGFSVDDGPLREYENNREFLESIKNGEVPQELVNQARGREVNVDMEDHHVEDYVEPKRKVKVFAGKGHVLGSPAPTTVAVTQPMTESDKETNEEAAKTALNTDSSQPSTTVQVRLVDGSRLLATLNHTHTIADLRRYISLARPNLGTSFYLRTTFPSAELTDNTKTLKDAGLLNAAVLMRLN